jgi:hypothetical protein
MLKDKRVNILKEGNEMPFTRNEEWKKVERKIIAIRNLY